MGSKWLQREPFSAPGWLHNIYWSVQATIKSTKTQALGKSK